MLRSGCIRMEFSKYILYIQNCKNKKIFLQNVLLVVLYICKTPGSVFTWIYMIFLIIFLTYT